MHLGILGASGVLCWRVGDGFLEVYRSAGGLTQAVVNEGVAEAAVRVTRQSAGCGRSVEWRGGIVRPRFRMGRALRLRRHLHRLRSRVVGTVAWFLISDLRPRRAWCCGGVGLGRR